MNGAAVAVEVADRSAHQCLACRLVDARGTKMSARLLDAGPQQSASQVGDVRYVGSSIFDVIDLVGSGCSCRHLGGAVEHDPRVVVGLVAVPPICPFQVLTGQVRGL